MKKLIAVAVMMSMVVPAYAYSYKLQVWQEEDRYVAKLENVETGTSETTAFQRLLPAEFLFKSSQKQSLTKMIGRGVQPTEPVTNFVPGNT